MATVRADHEGAVAFDDAVAGRMPDKSLPQRGGCGCGLPYSRPIGWNGARAGYANQPESGGKAYRT